MDKVAYSLGSKAFFILNSFGKRLCSVLCDKKKGEYTNPDGSKFEGEFKDGKRNG